MKKKLIGLTSVIIGFTFAAFAYAAKSGASPEYDMEKIQKGLADKILRFHVIANSDSDEDLALKLKVKENVINFLRPYMENSENISRTKEIIEKYDKEIMRIVTETIEESAVPAQGTDGRYTVHCEITTSYFPLKTYGDIMLPPGEYETYRIVIGEGRGSNWWCMLYPPLCFIDASCGTVPDSSMDMLKDMLSTEEYSVITGSYPKDCKIRFKYLTFLNRLFGL